MGVINGAFHQTKETSGVSNQLVGKNLKKKNGQAIPLMKSEQMS